MIVILMWVYYSAIIFLYGAELTLLSAKALSSTVNQEVGGQLD